MSDDFIEGGYDQFDPEDIARAEALRDTEQGKQDEGVQSYMRNRRRAYVEVFTEGVTSQGAIDFVMKDLAWFCKAHIPTFNANDGVHADTLMKMREGRREVYTRILDHTRLDYDTLFIKYNA